MMTDCAGEIVLTTGSRRGTNPQHRAPGGGPAVTGPPLNVPPVGVLPVGVLPVGVPPVGVPPVTGPDQDGAVCWRIVAFVSCWLPWPGQARPTACFR
jgi:hypothetical protein